MPHRGHSKVKVHCYPGPSQDTSVPRSGHGKVKVLRFLIGILNRSPARLILDAEERKYCKSTPLNVAGTPNK
mgnify:FL=1